MEYSFFLLSTLIFSVTLIILFFSKKHVENAETKIFSIALLVNLFGILIELTCKFLIFSLGNENIVIFIAIRLYLLYLLSFIYIMSYYIYYINYEKDNKIPLLSKNFY